jgi:hypothetical protein
LTRRIAACSVSSLLLPVTRAMSCFDVLPRLRSRSSSARRAGSSVVTAPPSPNAPRFLLGWKLKQPATPNVPARLPVMSWAPCACATSSTIGTRARAARALIAAIGQSRP